MARQLYPYAKVGGPVNQIPTRWAVLDTRKCKFGYVGLIERTRVLQMGPLIAYAVVQSPRPILSNGTSINAMKARPTHFLQNTSGRVIKGRDPEAWHSVLADAEAAYRRAVGRGGKL